MQEAVREKQLNIRLSDEEAARLLAVTEHYGINSAALFRMLLKREAVALGVEPKAAPKKAAAKR